MKKVVFLLILLLLTAYCFGCNASPIVKTYWTQNPDGTFHTNDVNRLQQKIPFKIIVPTFLPEGLSSGLLSIYGPSPVTSGSGIKGIELQISYQQTRKRLFITEDNLGEVLNPNPDLNPKYYDIRGINILRQKPRYSNDLGQSIWFDWTLNGISYGIKVYSISEDDGLKIVESIISQKNTIPNSTSL